MRPFPLSQCFNSKVEEYVSQKIIKCHDQRPVVATSSMETAKSRMQFVKASSPEKKYEVVDLSSDEPQVRHIDLQDDGSIVGEGTSNSLREDIATFAFFHNNHDNSEEYQGSLVEEQSPEWGKANYKRSGDTKTF